MGVFSFEHVCPLEVSKWSVPDLMYQKWNATLQRCALHDQLQQVSQADVVGWQPTTQVVHEAFLGVGGRTWAAQQEQEPVGPQPATLGRMKYKNMQK